MKKKRKNRTKSKYEVVRLWTYDQAKDALPYLRSVGSSLREHWLEAQAKSVAAQRLTKKPGRADKVMILALENVEKEHRHAEEAFQNDLEEMLAMHVFPVDINQGVALIPFREKDELAWYVFDLFDSKGMRSWRFHSDPLEKRRPITEVPDDQTTPEVA